MDCSKTKLDIPARYVFTIWSFFGISVVYACRTNLSVALVAMVSDIGKANNASAIQACPTQFRDHENEKSYSTKESHEQFDWDRKTQSQLLGAFFYGLVIAHLPGGMLATIWKPKWNVGIGVFLGSLFTALCPIAAKWNVNALIALRVLIGLSQGVVFPSFFHMVGKWAPKMERSRMGTVVLSGINVGNVIGLLLSGVLCESDFLGGWPSAFYVLGVAGMVWCIFWTFLIYDEPEEHPRISPAELLHISRDQTNEVPANTPWKSILTSVPVWAAVVAYFGRSWYFFTLITLMPTYLANILHMDIKENGFLSSLPFITMTVTSIIASCVADKMRQNGKVSITTIRKVLNSIGFFGSGFFLAFVTLIGCWPPLVVVFFSLSVGLNGAECSGCMVIPIDMSPNFTGVLWGIILTIGNCSGFLAPYLAGKITAQGETLHNWGIVFGIVSGVTFFTGLVFAIFASAELQPWDSPSELPKSKENIDEQRSSQKNHSIVPENTHM